MKKHIITEAKAGYQPAYVANGVIGLRVGTNPFFGQSALLQGFTGSHERFGIEALAPIPAPQYDLTMDGSSLKNFEEGYSLIEQSYDFAAAELETRFSFTNKRGQIAEGTSLIYASRSCPTLIIEEFTLTPKQDCTMDFSVLFEPTLLSVKTKDTFVPNADCHGVLLLESRDGSCTAGLAHLLEAEGEGISEINTDWGYEKERLQKKYRVQAKKGECYTFRHMVSYVPGSMHSEPHWQAVRMIELSSWKGFARLRAENRKCWGKLWESRVELSCDNPLWQDVIDASFFYLHCSIHPSSPQSMAPFGLSQRDFYKGHVFWDTESFMFTLPLFTDPASARAILDYRFERLEAARNNARINGYDGVQYPWQSGATGDEVTRVSAGGAGGAGEQHVNFDVAMAFISYWKLSGDVVYLKEKIWPVVSGVAKWIESRVEKTNRGYEILFVTGIDEGTDNIDNDAFTNILCKRILEEANKLCTVLGYPENEKWAEIARDTVLPINEEGYYMAQYEGCKEKPVTPSDPVMAFFPYGYSHSKELDENTYRFYIEHGMKEYLTYPMLSGFLGVIPARLGDRDLSREFFEHGNLTFFKDPFMMCTESSCNDENTRRVPDSGDVIFITGRGSLMTGLIMGLTGINIYRDNIEDWFETEAVLPAGFDKLVLNKVFIRGKAARITTVNGQKSKIEWL